MVIEKGFWPFRTAQIILDDDAAHVYAQKKGYGRIVAITRTKLDLPVFSTKEKPTVVIDLTRSEEEIFTSMSYENRHKIRKSEQDGNLAFKAGDSDFEKAYALYLSFEKARGSRPFPRSYFSKSVLFSCSIAGEMIAAIFVDMSKPHLRVRYIFSKRLGVGDKEEYRRINIASRRLVWEVCKWGKSNG